MSESTLSEHLQREGVELSPDQVERLDDFRRLLWDHNSRLNLTRHVTLEKFVTRDVVDALAFSRFLSSGEDVLDVGTGGGVPGVILAIVRDDVSISLVDSVGKKVRAVEEMLRELGLDLPVHHARAQDLLAEGETYDTLVIRAVARLEKLLRWFQPHWGSFRRMLVLKGPAWIKERSVCRQRNLIQHLDLRRLDEYPLPGSDSHSVLLQLTLKNKK